MRSFNKIFITITGLALFLSVGLTLGLQNRATKSQPVPTEGAFSQASGIGAWTDDRALVGRSHYIFVAQVKSDDGPLTVTAGIIVNLYSVRVLDNIKGELQGTVKLEQSRYANGDSSKPDDPLHVGATYVFATLFSVPQTSYILSAPPYDRKLITDDASLSDERLKGLASQDPRVLALRAAYPNEIISPVAHEFGLDWNNYESVKLGHPLLPDTIEGYQKKLSDMDTALAERRRSAKPSTSTTAADLQPSAPASEPATSVSPSASPELTATPEPTIEATATPEPSPTPSETPTPTPTPVPSATPVPSDLAPTPSI
ncbi:MAG: hypothetical protein LAO03_21530 [Acidobacteriia bacterium]|nr:hypothetical protein [Terriglobia bacterium]